MLGSTVDTCSSVDVLWRCLFQFIVKVVDTALIYRDRYAQFKLCKVVDYPVMAQRTFPLVPLQQTTEISQLQSIETVVDLLVVQFQQIRAKSWETSCNSNSPGQVVARPLCATTVAYGRRSSVQFIDGCERPCDHARQWKCRRFRSSRIFGGHSIATETGARLYSGSDDGPF